MSNSDIIAAHTATSLTRFRTRCLENEPSASWRNAYSSRWQVTLMYFGLNSMNLRTESRSSVLLIPLRGGTISIEGKGFLLSFSISLIFISLNSLFQCSCIRPATSGRAMFNAA